MTLDATLSEPGVVPPRAPHAPPTAPAIDRSRNRRSRRAADKDAILAVYDTHHRDLVRFAALVAPEPAMAEDLAHEAFVKLYGAWRRIDDPSRAAAYLRSTVVNLARARARHLGVIRRNRPEPRPDAASAESNALVKAERDQVILALRRLSDRQRACLVLRHYEDRTESEIARILGISIGSVRTHVHRGMQALQGILSREDDR
ncbi:MAG: SigE family RNA polymerase sigma factor [Acidimicrobiales bacterium]